LVDHAVVGVFEVLKNYGFFKKLFGCTLQWVEEFRPKAILLIDYPGFNLRLAEALRKKGLSRKGGRGYSGSPVCESTALGVEAQKKI
jgi:lipid-A-disaccharide synthase